VLKADTFEHAQMANRKSPARPTSYDKKVALVLQGRGALGSYQAGAYEALAASEYLPDWVAGEGGRPSRSGRWSGKGTKRAMNLGF
jgi:hypothetical protein